MLRDDDPFGLRVRFLLLLGVQGVVLQLLPHHLF